MKTFSAMWSDKLGHEIKRAALEQCPTGYRVEMPNGSDFEALREAVNQGIDSHLEAVQFTEFAGDYGWSVNTPFNIGRGLNREEAIARLRSRWEIFKANYDSKARVQDLTDISDGFDGACNLEVNCTAFADVRLVVESEPVAA